MRQIPAYKRPTIQIDIPWSKDVKVKGKKTTKESFIVLRGLKLAELSDLYRLHKFALEALFEKEVDKRAPAPSAPKLKTAKPGDLKKRLLAEAEAAESPEVQADQDVDELMNIAKSVMLCAPELVPIAILYALSDDDTDLTREAIAEWEITFQINCLVQIFDLTFESDDEIKKLFASILKLVKRAVGLFQKLMGAETEETPPS